MRNIKLCLLLGLSCCYLVAQIPKIERNLQHTEYKIVGQDTLRVHWYAPQTDDFRPTPAMAFFFGGGWRGGDYTHFQRQALYFSQRGLTTFLFDYRTESKHNTSPVECIKDARSALRFLKKHQKKFNIDPQKIIVSGGSAGGHIAAATATLHQVNEATDDLAVDPKPAAMVLFNPVFDNGPNGYHGSSVSKWLEEDFRCYCRKNKIPNGKWASLFKSHYKQLSPFHNIIPDTPPALVMFGSEDDLVPVSTAEAFQKKMEQSGTRCEVLIYKGAKHGFFNGVRKQSGPPNPEAQAYFYNTLQATDDFLLSLGYLSEKANVRDYFNANQL
jgi:acetyl esterase/lipase